jgi:hypothetical protein
MATSIADIFTINHINNKISFFTMRYVHYDTNDSKHYSGKTPHDLPDNRRGKELEVSSADFSNSYDEGDAVCGMFLLYYLKTIICVKLFLMV